MGLEAMRGDDHELLDSVILPLRHQLVDRAVQGLAAEPRAPRPGIPADRHPVGDGRRAKDPEPFGYAARHRVGDPHVGAERKVGPVLLERAHRQDQSGIRRERTGDLAPGDLVESI